MFGYVNNAVTSFPNLEEFLIYTSCTMFKPFIIVFLFQIIIIMKTIDT